MTVFGELGEEHNLKGHCFAIKCDDNYVGIMLTGEAIEDPFDPPEVKGKCKSNSFLRKKRFP